MRKLLRDGVGAGEVRDVPRGEEGEKSGSELGHV